MPYANPIVIQDDLLSAIPPDQDDRAIFSEVMLSRLNIVSQCLANAEAAMVSVTLSTMAELDDLFASLDLESSGPPAQVECVVSPTQWLLDNLHNPYPSGAAKRAMEESPELCSRTVNEWFARARQRIGWTRLLRDRFSGCRSAATDAAFRAFVRDDPRSPLDAELYAAFMAVKAHANLVYAPLSPGILDITPHPSLPSRSPSATPSLTHSSDSEDSDDDASQPSRKRKRSFSELSSDPHPISSMPRKRRSTPSPERTSHIPFLSTTLTQNISSPPRSRKRRLSESNSDEPTVKKPRRVDWAPRKQTISDPLPLPTLSFDWESWCTEAFVLPPSATTNHLVPDALDFELFNFEAFPASQPTDTTDSPAGTCLEFPEQPGGWVDSLFITPSQAEKGPWSASWEDFFNFELPCHSSPLPSLTPSLTNSPSSPNTQWSLSPPELPYFDSLESTLFDFSSPSLFKIPTLYPADGVEVALNGSPLIS
ncbi:hypothetical protein BDM02DRAFT_3115268 [Thelephora ganbajun]|uniref:Uncharacterized protein n=1 Tax=Thelephora ganbajun TaxID=370292 RepID=A0ACB6ZG04_THEGA|nr:hypothetical protein BDM02DRAFT_3115268 [Thelephora ganbajun]